MLIPNKNITSYSEKKIFMRERNAVDYHPVLVAPSAAIVLLAMFCAHPVTECKAVFNKIDQVFKIGLSQ